MEKAAFSVGEFCQRNAISRSFFYKLINSGNAPRMMLVGTHKRITREAELEWHQRMEAEAATAAAVRPTIKQVAAEAHA
jgi:excisionase family DNA binding protein